MEYKYNLYIILYYIYLIFLLWVNISQEINVYLFLNHSNLFCIFD